MPGIDYETALNTSLNIKMSTSDAIILRNCLVVVLSFRPLSDSVRKRIESIDKLLWNSYKNIDVPYFNIDTIVKFSGS